MLHHCNQQQPGGILRQQLLGSIGRELHDHLHGGKRDGEQSNVEHHSFQPVNDLRRNSAGNHRDLQRLRERRLRFKSDAWTFLLDDGDQQQPGGNVRQQLLGSVRRKLHDQLHGGQRDGEQGNVEHHSFKPVNDLRRNGGHNHRDLQRLCER